jgi:hypothetical protein
MTWFHFNKLDAITTGRRNRRELAETIQNRTFREEFYETNIKLVEEAIRTAKREDELYAEYLGEPMPEHMRKAIEAEVVMWITLHDILFKPAVPEERYGELCRKLRPYVAILIDLLHAEEEMMRSPLTKYYVKHVDAWRTEAARVRP